VACYCDDCQEGSRQIEALPGAASIRGPDGGTEYLAYRKDRIKCSKGAAFLQSHKIRQTSVTNRVVANCCNSAMYLNFDDGKYWVDLWLPSQVSREALGGLDDHAAATMRRQRIGVAILGKGAR
jgi:hypothetical protein